MYNKYHKTENLRWETFILAAVDFYDAPGLYTANWPFVMFVQLSLV